VPGAIALLCSLFTLSDGPAPGPNAYSAPLEELLPDDVDYLNDAIAPSLVQIAFSSRVIPPPRYALVLSLAFCGASFLSLPAALRAPRWTNAGCSSLCPTNRLHVCLHARAWPYGPLTPYATPVRLGPGSLACSRVLQPFSVSCVLSACPIRPLWRRSPIQLCFTCLLAAVYLVRMSPPLRLRKGSLFSPRTLLRRVDELFLAISHSFSVWRVCIPGVVLCSCHPVPAARCHLLPLPQSRPLASQPDLEAPWRLGPALVRDPGAPCARVSPRR